MLKKMLVASILTVVFCITGLQTSAIPRLARADTGLDFYAGIEKLSKDLTASIRALSENQGVKNVSVADLTGPGDRVYVGGEYVAKKLGLALMKAKTFPKFMERKEIGKILEAMAVEMSDLYDPKTAGEFGKLIGVDAVVIGTVEDLGNLIDITAKIVESETGRLLAMADCQVKKGHVVKDLLFKERTATLTVNVIPPVSGKIIIGGETNRLKDGIAIIQKIPYGANQVIIQPDQAGYDTVSTQANIRSRTQTVTYDLDARKCMVSFQVIPPDATLIVNGNKVDLNPHGFASIDEFDTQVCSYVAQAKGFETFEMQRFKPCENSLITLDLVTSDPFYNTKKKLFKTYKKASKNSAFKVKLWTDKSQYLIDDPIHFYFETEKDCFVNLINVGSSGNITVLFPNRYHSNNLIKAGVKYKIPGESYPFGLVVQPPPGNERVYAIASTWPIDIFTMDFEKQVFTSLTRTNTRDIGVIKQVGNKLDRAKLQSSAECIVYKQASD